MDKKLEDGEHPATACAGRALRQSPCTASIGCTGCHADINPAAHPPADKKIQSARSFAVSTTQLCRNCHADKFEQWQTSIHAALVRAGNPAAPICTDCHNPHAVIKGAAATVDQAPCKKCHNEIYTAYLGSVHAKSRLRSKDSYAPVCSGCHSAHAVKPTSVGALAQGPEGACFGCHAGVLEAASEMAAQCRPAFRSGVLPCLPRAHCATQSRSHADRQQEREGARDRAARRAAVRGQRPFRQQRHRCADAVEPDADARSQRHRRQDHVARSPGSHHRPADARDSPTRARRSATATPVTARARRRSRA